MLVPVVMAVSIWSAVGRTCEEPLSCAAASSIRPAKVTFAVTSSQLAGSSSNKQTYEETNSPNLEIVNEVHDARNRTWSEPSSVHLCRFVQRPEHGRGWQIGSSTKT